MTQQQIKSSDEDDYYCDDDKIVKWYEGHQKHKAQKAKIKDELMPIAWYPSRWCDWCVPDDQKKKRDRNIVGMNMDLFVSFDWIQKFF